MTFVEFTCKLWARNGVRQIYQLNYRAPLSAGELSAWNPWRNQHRFNRIPFEKLRRSWKRLRLFVPLHPSSSSTAFPLWLMKILFSHFAHCLNALWHISRMCTRLNGVEVPKIPLATPKSGKYVKRPCRLTSQEKWTLKIKFVTNYGWGGWLIAGFAAAAV